MNHADLIKQVSPELEKMVAQRARDRAMAARWDLNVAVFLFAVLITILILLFEGVRVEVVAPIAVFGLGMVWLVGWRRGKQLYKRFYDEELAQQQQELSRTIKKVAKEAVEETIEEKVQKALRERWR